MSDLNNLDIRYPHQFWFLAILRAFIPELSTNIKKGRRRVNATFTAKSPITFWGDLAIYLSQREVLVEHYSDAPGFADIAKNWLMLATAVHRYIRNMALWTTGVWSHVAHCYHRIAKRSAVPVVAPFCAHPK